MLEKAVEFIEKYYNRKTAVIFDTDGDGISAAAILVKTLEKKFKNSPLKIPSGHDHNITKNVYEKILSKKVETVITLDLAVDENPEYLIKLSKKARILVIDHHQVHEDLNKVENIVHLNPHFWKSQIEPYKYPVSKIIFDICMKLGNIEDLDWLAAIGIINDVAGNKWKGFLDDLYEKYEYLKKGKDIYSFDSEIGYLTHLITSGYYLSKDRGGLLGLNACLEASSPMDLIKLRTKSIKKLKKNYDKVESEIQRIMKNWKNYAEIIKEKNLIILKLPTKLPIQSPIATKIGIKETHHTILVVRTDDKTTNISLRRGDGKINCGKLASNSIRGLKNADGGGHIPAAGVHIMTKDWRIFIKNIQKLL